MAHTLSAANNAFKSTLAPVLDMLRDMTKRARAGAAEALTVMKAEARKSAEAE